MGFPLLISFLFLVGFAMLGWGMHSCIRGRQSLSWPATEGELLECQLENDGDGQTPTWKLKVRYTYSVDGETFEGTRVAFGYCGSTWQEDHQRIHDKLQQSSRVTVRYQPDHPANAVLEAGTHRLTFLVLTFAIVWLMIMISVALVWLSPLSLGQPITKPSQKQS